jgi:hypothetical protein
MVTKKTTIMKYFSLILSSLLFISCSGSKTLLKSLNRYRAPLDYLFDSKIKECDRSASVAIVNFDSSALDSTTSVSKINRRVFPFIIYNYEELNLAVKLGQSSLTQCYSDFFIKSFTVESQRTGCYSVVANPDESKYTIEIAFDTCAIYSKYKRSSRFLYLLIAYSMSIKEIGFPAKTDLILNLKLMKYNNLIFEKKYFIDNEQPYLKSFTGDENIFRSDFISNMVESLSLITKTCIEQIIFDINQIIEKTTEK